VVKKEKLSYVTPVVRICRVMLEANIVADVSLGRVSARIGEDWSSDEVLGDDATSEGGDLYWSF
jgi:hypothetical protein